MSECEGSSISLSPEDVRRFWGKVDMPSDAADVCLEWRGTISELRGGYGAFNIRGKLLKAHRIAWLLLVGQIPEGLHVCHDCPRGDNPRCVRPAHMFLGTHADNSADCVAKGRQARGMRHGMHRCTEEMVLEIRRRSTTGESQRSLARFFGLSQSAVSAIVLRRNWSHLKEVPDAGV